MTEEELKLLEELGEKMFDGMTLAAWMRLINEVRRLREEAHPQILPMADDCICAGGGAQPNCPVHGTCQHPRMTASKDRTWCEDCGWGP